jgi:hypothetical protein
MLIFSFPLKSSLHIQHQSSLNSWNCTCDKDKTTHLFLFFHSNLLWSSPNLVLFSPNLQSTFNQLYRLLIDFYTSVITYIQHLPVVWVILLLSPCIILAKGCFLSCLQKKCFVLGIPPPVVTKVTTALQSWKIVGSSCFFIIKNWTNSWNNYTSPKLSVNVMSLASVGLFTALLFLGRDIYQCFPNIDHNSCVGLGIKVNAYAASTYDLTVLLICLCSTVCLSTLVLCSAYSHLP